MKRILPGLALAAFFGFLAFYHLSDYPTTWFDEGVHLHVPENLVRFGVYADRSSDGFRYFGPTLGVGPTVMLPIAAVFRLFGIGLVQGRIVIALYLLTALFLFYRLARRFESRGFAVLAMALLLTTPAVGLVETGRQVLGEVPGLCFLLAGLLVWFSAWDGPWGRLTLAGLLLGAAAVTKYQNLVVLTPAIGLAAVANLLYYRTARLRVFVWPGLVMLAMFGLWQAALVMYLGPQTSAENLATLRQVTAGAAAVFSPDAMKRTIRQLLSFNTYGGSLILAIAYGFFRSSVRSRTDQQWGILWLFIVVNLGWYMFASIGWPRYAFAGLAFASLFVARFFLDLLARLNAARQASDGTNRAGEIAGIRGLQAAVVIWALLIVLPSFATTVLPIMRPPQNSPAEMSAFLNREVPQAALIETWEQELGALTTHNYHYPPARLLNVAVRHIWLEGPSPRLAYHPLEDDRPPYVVVGNFARWVGVYPGDVLAKEYTLLTTIGGYELYRRSDAPLARASTSCVRNC